VDVAETAEQAHELLSHGAYDVVVSDIGLPGASGIELLRKVRQHDLDVPVILVTGAPELDSAIAALEYGAFRYFVKPLDREATLVSVRRAMSAHRLAKLKRTALEFVPAAARFLGDRAALEARFELALASLFMEYQPIVDITAQEERAYEALLRSNEPSLAHPAALLDCAERLGRLHELGRAIRSAVSRDAERAPVKADLFVNLHPNDLLDPELYDASSALSRLASRVVLEVTERSSLERVPGVPKRMEELRKLGYRVALDDLGAGYAGLTSFSMLEPEFVKFDRSLVDRIDQSETKARIARAMLELCNGSLGITVIGEGVERPEERDLLVRSGCTLLQGWLFARSSRDFVRVFC
jgi:EAL domain-containing protein (putative c-di-GMP-specific phosphodiesterase class I)